IYTLLWIEVAIWLWILGEKSTLFSVLSGFFVVWAGLWENAPTNAFFLGSGFFLLTALRLHGWKMVWLDATRHRINSFWFGVFAALLVFVFQLSQHWAEFGATWSHLQRGSLRLLAANTVMAPVYLSNMVKFMPLTIGLALFMFLFFAKNAIRPVARHRKLDEVRLWFLAWFVVGAGYFTILQVPPLESLVLLVPPLCVIAAEGLCALVSLRKIENPRVDVMIVSLLISGVVWFATAWWVNRFYHTMNLPAYFETHQIRGSLILVLLMWFVITSLLIWIYLKWQNFSFRPARGLMLVMAWAIGISVVGMSVRFHQDWWNSREYTVRDGSQKLADLPPGSLVVGSWAPLLTLDKNIGATVVWNGLNESPRDWHRSVTHLLLAQGNESRPHLPPSSTFIQQGRKLKLLENAGISVGGKPLNLYELSP
ncbi:MAG: hypothetical protein HKN21_13625, partial [Candidatus Eisenbacteria bacterium]|nr:hypothetical protein [Candidatus Eisenbacteria bacterium]